VAGKGNTSRSRDSVPPEQARGPKMICVPRSHLSLSRPSPAATRRPLPRTACSHDHLPRDAARACLLASSRPLGTESASLPWFSAQRSASSGSSLGVDMTAPASLRSIRHLLRNQVPETHVRALSNSRACVIAGLSNFPSLRLVCVDTPVLAARIPHRQHPRMHKVV
jgi:hypothetical protein